MKKVTKFVMTLALLSALCACGSSSEDAEKRLIEKQDTPEGLYLKARGTFDEKAYVSAITQFEEVEQQHPYSPWAKRAQVMAAYSAYRAGKFDDAINIIDRFVQLYPTDDSTPYAYYLKSLAFYTQITDVGRDQQKTEQAREALRDVMARYPESEYAQDAALKLDLTDNHLAGKEMEVGRYYLNQQEYLAAINRFKLVVKEYDTTSHAAEALHRLVETYLRLGVVGEAKKYAAVLGYNYPGSDWYKYSYAMIQGNLSPEEKTSVFDQYLNYIPL